MEWQVEEEVQQMMGTRTTAKLYMASAELSASVWSVRRSNSAELT